VQHDGQHVEGKGVQACMQHTAAHVGSVGP
jgi:hypothetical protein